ncbi:MAG: zinc-ribbon domain-containing protein [Alphaproteobacteria bacterium]|nr:zinc-ribbon domain-containing protein [Alphaproteobacteria bacterium]
MILTCSACQSKFSLDSALLRPAGKNVRCSDCGNTWFQTPDPDDLLSDIEATITAQQAHAQTDIPIPDGVKPGPMDERPFKSMRPAPEPSGPSLVKASILKALLLPLILTAALLALFLSFKDPTLRAWPQSLALYRVLGQDGVLPGEGLAFDKVSARQEGKAILIEGKIINLGPETRLVPLIMVTLRAPKAEAGAEPLAKWLIAPPQETIAGEATMPFSARYDPLTDAPPIPPDAQVTVRFLLRQ